VGWLEGDPKRVFNESCSPQSRKDRKVFGFYFAFRLDAKKLMIVRLFRGKKNN